jgi:hypothetical protein
MVFEDSEKLKVEIASLYGELTPLERKEEDILKRRRSAITSEEKDGCIEEWLVVNRAMRDIQDRIDAAKLLLQQDSEAKQDVVLRPERRKRAVQDIPYAAEFLQTFPSAAHDAFGDMRNGFQFGAEVGIHSRYVLNLRVPFITAADKVSVVSFGRPEFKLLEVSRIDQLPGGLLTPTFLPVGEFRFDAYEWRKVVHVRGDFSVIGYAMVTNRPVEFFGKIWKNHSEKKD